jgi:chromosome segregation ATPase
MSDTSTIDRPIAVTIPEESALKVFTAVNGIDPYLEMVRQEIDSFVAPSVETAAGRKEIASFAFKVGKIKNYIEGVGKEQAVVAKAIPKLIDAARRKAFDTLNQWQDEVRKPLTDWEEAEKKRVSDLEEALAEVQRTASFAVLEPSIEEINGRLGWLSELMPRDWQEFAEKAAEAGHAARATLTALRDAAVKREAERAELAKLRAESEARAEQERKERAAREAEEERQRVAEAAAAAEREKAETAARVAAEAAEAERQRIDRERQDAEARAAHAEQDRKDVEERARLAAEKAEQDRIEAAAQAGRDRLAAVEAERQRVADEEAKVRAETAAREADKKHRNETIAAAAGALANCGLTSEQAGDAMLAIVDGKIPNVSITF